jgi:hypothetical protein
MTRLITEPVLLNSPRTYASAFDVKPNEPLIRQVMAFIDTNRDRWDQDRYLDVGDCGMVGCFAGWALLITEYGERLPLALADDPREIMREVRQASSRASIVVRLGLDPDQFNAIYDFVVVHDEQDGELRHPTFEELVDLVARVTGVRYQRGEGATT